MKWKSHARIILPAAVILVVLYFYLPSSNNLTDFPSKIDALMLLLVDVIYLPYLFARDNKVRSARSKILLAFANKNKLTYTLNDSNRQISAKPARILSLGGTRTLSNFITGKYDDLQLAIYGVEFTFGLWNASSLLVCELPLKSFPHVVCAPRALEADFGIFNGFGFKGSHLIDVGAAFGSKYNVYTSDPAIAKTIFGPQLRQLMTRVGFPRRMGFEILDGKLYTFQISGGPDCEQELSELLSTSFAIHQYLA